MWWCGVTVGEGEATPHNPTKAEVGGMGDGEEALEHPHVVNRGIRFEVIPGDSRRRILRSKEEAFHPDCFERTVKHATASWCGAELGKTALETACNRRQGQCGQVPRHPGKPSSPCSAETATPPR